MSTQHYIISTVCAVLGGFASVIFGELNNVFIALFVCVCVDLIMGILCGVLGKSSKTATGTLSSKAMLQGLFKKVGIFASVAVSYWAGIATGYTELRDAVIVFFIASEMLSIIENGGLLGIPYPKKLKNLIENLRDDEEGA